MAVNGTGCRPGQTHPQFPQTLAHQARRTEPKPQMWKLRPSGIARILRTPGGVNYGTVAAYCAVFCEQRLGSWVGGWGPVSAPLGTQETQVPARRGPLCRVTRTSPFSLRLVFFIGCLNASCSRARVLLGSHVPPRTLAAPFMHQVPEGLGKQSSLHSSGRARPAVTL